MDQLPDAVVIMLIETRKLPKDYVETLRTLVGTGRYFMDRGHLARLILLTEADAVAVRLAFGEAVRRSDKHHHASVDGAYWQVVKIERMLTTNSHGEQVMEVSNWYARVWDNRLRAAAKEKTRRSFKGGEKVTLTLNLWTRRWPEVSGPGQSEEGIQYAVRDPKHVERVLKECGIRDRIQAKLVTIGEGWGQRSYMEVSLTDPEWPQRWLERPRYTDGWSGGEFVLLPPDECAKAFADKKAKEVERFTFEKARAANSIRRVG
jgi:hypothetical protein